MIFLYIDCVGYLYVISTKAIKLGYQCYKDILLYYFLETLLFYFSHLGGIDFCIWYDLEVKFNFFLRDNQLIRHQFLKGYSSLHFSSTYDAIYKSLILDFLFCSIGLSALASVVHCFNCCPCLKVFVSDSIHPPILFCFL